MLVAAVGLAATIGNTWSAFASSTQSAGNTFSAAASFCVGGEQTVTAAADSYVDQGSAASNFGTATSVRVRSASTAIVLLPDNARTLVRFTLPTIPAHCSLTDARLRLFASSASAGRVLQAYRAGAAWNETGVTWNNQPTLVGTASLANSGTGWREWSVLAHVQAMYSGTNNGFVVRDSAESALLAATQVYSSRNGTNPPQLVLTFA